MPKAKINLQVAVLSSPVAVAGGAVPKRIKLLPAGRFTAHDGRPANLEGVTASAWELTPAQSVAVMNAFVRRNVPMLIDYEHQTLEVEKNGRPNPAAGWITALSFEPGDGLYGDVTWTETAAAHLTKGEYRFISPVFPFDKTTGVVTDLLHVALTNTPGLDTSLLPALAALSQTFSPVSQPPEKKDPTTMNLQALIAILGLAATATENDVLVALNALKSSAADKTAEIAALKALAFDPTKHIPLQQHKIVADQLAALSAAQETAERDGLVTAALSDARILPPQETYFRTLPLAALKAYLKDAQPLAVLTGTQTGGKPPATGAAAGGASLSADELAVCKAMGMTAEAFVKARAAA